MSLRDWFDRVKAELARPSEVDVAEVRTRRVIQDATLAVKRANRAVAAIRQLEATARR